MALSEDSFAIATIQGHPGGVHVVSVASVSAGGRRGLRIHFSGAVPPGGVTVGSLVLEG